MKYFYETSITRGLQLVQRDKGSAQGGLGHGEPLPHVLDTDPHLNTLCENQVQVPLTTHLSLSVNVVLGSEGDS